MLEDRRAQPATRRGVGLAEPVSGIVESVGKVAFHKFTLNKVNYLRVEELSRLGFSYRLVRRTIQKSSACFT